MTDLLYQTDAMLREFDATIVTVEGERLELDRTAFYPTGGGQPHDRGWLEAAGRRVAVTAVTRAGDRVWHAAPGHAWVPGQAVHAVLDWQRRHDLMRTHTALHVLSAIIWRDFGAPVTGGNMEPLQGRLDFELEAQPPGFVAHLETALAAEIAAARPVQVQLLPRAAALEIPDLIRTKVNLLPPTLQVIRTVHIVGLDLQADGGTHVANTRDIGGVRVVETKSKGKAFKRVRIEIVDG